jgi:hypothetical protein
MNPNPFLFNSKSGEKREVREVVPHQAYIYIASFTMDY